MSPTDVKLAELVKRMQAAAGANLESVILYGSAARGDSHEGISDLNVFCTLRTLAVEELARLSPVVIWWTTKRKSPRRCFLRRRSCASPQAYLRLNFSTCRKAIACCTARTRLLALPCR